MNEKKTFEENLRRAFAPHEPKSGLRQKVLNLSPRVNRRPLWVACGFAGLAGAGVLAAMLVLPATSLAQAVLNQAKAFEGHLTSYDVLPNGHWLRTGDMWLKGGRVRFINIGAHPSEVLHDPELGCNIALNVDMGTVSVMELKVQKKFRQFVPEILTPENLKDYLAGRGIHETPRVERTQFNGQPADCLSLSSGKFVEDKLYADPVTHRMLGMSNRFTKVWPGNPPENNYTHLYLVDPKLMPPHIFEPVFNIDGVPTNVLEERAKWQERLSKSLRSFTFNLRPRPHLPSMKGGSQVRTVNLRNVMVNPLGDVFVLFTGVHGEYGTNVVPTTIHDSTGGQYVKGISFLPSDDGNHLFKNFSYDGLPLEGSWFIRIGGGPVKGPITVGFKQEFEPGSKLTFAYPVEPERIDREIPAYMPYMYLPIGTHSKWLEMRTDSLAEARDRANDYVAEERLIRQMIALNKNSFYQPADLDCRLASVLEKQDKKQQALAMYEEAQKALATERIDPGPWIQNQINAGLKRLSR